MKTTIIALVLAQSSLVNLTASEPYDSYLNASIQGAGDNLWWVYPREIDGQTITPPKGGYFFRILIDIDGDGVNEIFLTDNGQVMKDGVSWTLYRKNSSGNYVKLDGNAWLPWTLWVKTDGGVKKYSWVTPLDKDTGLESISTFWLDGSGNFQTSSVPLTEAQSKAINGDDQTLLGTNGLPDANKIAQYLQIGSLVTLTIQKALVGMLYQNTATWRAVNSTFALSQQYLDPADAADIASLASWTPPPSP